MSRRRRIWLLCTLAALAFLWLNNTSLFSSDTGEPVFIAHRGLAQEMHPEHENVRTCLSRIRAPAHTYIENTIPSIKAAFDLGATFVEIDVRRTLDGQFAVFHDDILNCKTEAAGLVSDHSMDELRALDVGFGYVTQDGSHPLRGLGHGLMPSLEEVLDHFPTGSFIINVKDDLSSSPEAFLHFIDTPAANVKRRLLIFGGESTARAIREHRPMLVAASRASARHCIRDYVLVGWTGYVPERCRSTVTGMYANYGWLLWGWPHRFVERMARVDTLVLLTHPYQDESVHDLPETSDYARLIPKGYSGGVVTNRIDKIQVWMQEGG